METASRKNREVPTTCICGATIEWVAGFGWREVGTAQGYVCYRDGGGRMMAEAHEPYAEDAR